MRLDAPGPFRATGQFRSSLELRDAQVLPEGVAGEELAGGGGERQLRVNALDLAASS